jgi:hypothetical protein
VNIIQLFTNLDWFRFHGKQNVTNQLHQHGFYDIKISRKMNLEDCSSYIRISGIYLSIEEGAVYGTIKVYKDRIESNDDITSSKMQTIIEANSEYFFAPDKKKYKQNYYQNKKIFYK